MSEGRLYTLQLLLEEGIDMVDALELSASGEDAALIDTGVGLALTHGVDEQLHTLHYLLVGVGGQVVGAKQKEYRVGTVAVELAVHHPPDTPPHPRDGPPPPRRARPLSR